jgi:4-diphosphocytidyl-2-C-methyl-D-erythritol kinase
MTPTITARAKINLHLHITGRAENNYHLLDSLVAFTDIKDTIEITAADKYIFSVTGDFEKNLCASSSAQDNLITRAALALSTHYHLSPNFHITLNKSIPLGAGLGGGSADAAATLKALCDFWNIPRDNTVLHTIAGNLGSDIAACLSDTPVIMRDTGNTLLPAPKMPQIFAVLVNPNTSCPTPLVYQTYAKLGADFSDPITFPETFQSARALCNFLNSGTHNDLTEAAIAVNPDVATVLNALNTVDDCALARLSGSGSTCFALFESRLSAEKASEIIKINNPDWWVRVTSVN